MPLASALAFFSQEVDARPIGYVRAIIGAAALLRAQEAYSILTEVLRPGLMRLPYMPGLPDLPPLLLPVLIAVWAAAALAFLLGWRTRLAGTALTAAMGYVLLLDQQSYSNHLYLLTVIAALLTVGNAGAAFSLDARRRGYATPARAWTVCVLKIQLSLVYGFGAFAKMTPAFLNGSLMATYLSPKATQLLNLLPADWSSPLLIALSLSGSALEAFLAVGFWVPRLRTLCATLGLSLHAFMIAALSPAAAVQIQIFAVAATSLYLLFLLPSRRVTTKLEPVEL